MSEYASLRVQSCTFTTGLERAQWIVGKGGVIDVTGCNFLSSRDLSLPGIELSAGSLSTLPPAASIRRPGTLCICAPVGASASSPTA